MGCDIHMYVEIKRTNNSITKWWSGDYWVNYDPIHTNSTAHMVPIYDNRSYSLFATLADVRNYGATEYIDLPRGLPDDVTEFVKQEYEDSVWYAHSASYFTLKELIEFYDRNPLRKLSGLISPEAQEQLDNHGILPDSWCQGTNKEGWERRSWEDENTQLADLIDKLKVRADELNLIYGFCWISDNEKTRKDALEAASNIRIVFWFDN